MDVKAPQVALATVIGEYSLNDNEESGFDYFVKYKNKVVGTSRNISNSQVPIPLPGATAMPSPSGSPILGNGVLDPANLINFSQIIQNLGTGTNVYVAAGNYLATVVHLLETTGRFRVISRPMVFTSNNKKAIIASGTEIPVPVSSLTNAGSNLTGVASVASNIQFKKVALQLEVVPLINSEKEVSLDILQKIDSVAGTTTVDNNNIPNIATRYIRTTVSAPNGATIVLGGLMTDSKQRNMNGIPLLDRIPIIGYLFRSTTDAKTRSELIILMRPEVTLSKLDLYRLRETTKEKMAIKKDFEKFPPLNQGEYEEEYETSEKQLPPPDLPPIRQK
jgi:general secretion pathway protein D